MHDPPGGPGGGAVEGHGAQGGKAHRSSEYQWRQRTRRLAEMGFRCHLALGQPEEAIEYFQHHWRWSANPEVHLFCLLDLLEEAGLPDRWCREYDRAVAKGVKPRIQLERRRSAWQVLR